MNEFRKQLIDFHKWVGTLISVVFAVASAFAAGSDFSAREVQLLPAALTVLFFSLCINVWIVRQLVYLRNSESAFWVAGLSSSQWLLSAVGCIFLIMPGVDPKYGVLGAIMVSAFFCAMGFLFGSRSKRVETLASYLGLPDVGPTAEPYTEVSDACSETVVLVSRNSEINQ